MRAHSGLGTIGEVFHQPTRRFPHARFSKSRGSMYENICIYAVSMLRNSAIIGPCMRYTMPSRVGSKGARFQRQSEQPQPRVAHIAIVEARTSIKMSSGTCGISLKPPAFPRSCFLVVDLLAGMAVSSVFAPPADITPAAAASVATLPGTFAFLLLRGIKNRLL